MESSSATASEILARVEHRPWPIASGPWIMRQRWHELLFAHVPIDADRMRAAIPRELELDTFEGRAWLGVVPFRMSDIRFRGAPKIPGASAFAELNLRTYVNYGGRPGVWFFSLDAANRIAVEVARRWFHLPYFSARMSVDERDGFVEYSSERVDVRGPRAELRARYRPIGACAAPRGSLEHWLTERYCLYSRTPSGRILRGEIHHAPWPLERAEVEFEVDTLASPLGFDVERGPRLAHFARSLEVLVWRPTIA